MTTVNVALTAVQIMPTSAFNLITVMKTKISAALLAVQVMRTSAFNLITGDR